MCMSGILYKERKRERVCVTSTVRLYRDYNLRRDEMKDGSPIRHTLAMLYNHRG